MKITLYTCQRIPFRPRPSKQLQNARKYIINTCKSNKYDTVYIQYITEILCKRQYVPQELQSNAIN